MTVPVWGSINALGVELVLIRYFEPFNLMVICCRCPKFSTVCFNTKSPLAIVTQPSSKVERQIPDLISFNLCERNSRLQQLLLEECTNSIGSRRKPGQFWLRPTGLSLAVHVSLTRPGTGSDWPH